jgi:hypothetical protein
MPSAVRAIVFSQQKAKYDISYVVDLDYIVTVKAIIDVSTEANLQTLNSHHYFT